MQATSMRREDKQTKTPTYNQPNTTNTQARKQTYKQANKQTITTRNGNYQTNMIPARGPQTVLYIHLNVQTLESRQV